MLLREQELSKRGAGEEQIAPAIAFERSAPFLARRKTFDPRRQRVAFVVREAGRSDESSPVGEVQIDPLFPERWRVDAVDTSRRRDSKQSQGARLDLTGELTIAADPRCHLPPQQRRQRGATARERNVVRVSWRYVHGFCDQANQQIVSASCRTARPRNAWGRRFEPVEEISQCLDR